MRGIVGKGDVPPCRCWMARSRRGSTRRSEERQDERRHEDRKERRDCRRRSRVRREPGAFAVLRVDAANASVFLLRA
jgi:hypothetical protein